MKPLQRTPTFCRRLCFSALLLPSLSAVLCRAQFVAFNDQSPGPGTALNATAWDVFGNSPGSAGPLRDINSGLALPIQVAITATAGVVPAAGGVNPNVGTPLDNVFHGFVDFQGAGSASALAEVSGSATVTYVFTGLDPRGVYSFKGSAVAGGLGVTPNLQWSLYELDGAAAFASAHTPGCYTNGLAANQVAIDTGLNTSGDMADWENIVPGTNGSFAVVCSQYTGPIPLGGTASGPQGYAMSGFRLEAINPNAPRITALASTGNQVEVSFSLPVQAAGATNVAHYSLTNLYGGVPILAAALSSNPQRVELTTARQLPFMRHWLTVNGVADALTGTNLIAPNSQGVCTNIGFTAGYLESEYYLGIPGANLSALTSNPRYPNSPSKTVYLGQSYWFDSTIGLNYGNRMWGILAPPVSGDYTFYIYSPGAAQISLSTNENSAFASVIASITNAYASDPIPLVAGQHYYFEALTKEGNPAEDYAELLWTAPNGGGLIPPEAMGNFLNPPNATVTLTGQPVDANVFEARSATFSVTATSNSQITSPNYQWQMNGVDIPGATSASYTTPLLYLTNNGTSYRVLVFVPGAARFSSNAVARVTRDLTPPKVVEALSFNGNNVQVLFSKPVDPISAANRSNYLFTNGLVIRALSLDTANLTVTLATDPLVSGSNYTILIHNIQDQAYIPNTISPNTRVSFAATLSTPSDIGNPKPASIITVRSNGVSVVAGGSDIGGAADQFAFDYQMCSGDFDVSLRVNGLSFSDAWAKAGLMARETLNPTSRFAASLATPTLNGVLFVDRDSAGGAPLSSGSFPVNFPDTWVRLQRLGASFTGFGSYDGHTWTPLGSAYITMSNLLYVGFAVCSHNSNQPVTVQFQPVQNVGANSVVGVIRKPHDLLGPTSRKSPIAISEIMYKPAPRADGKNVEFLELYNSNPWFHDVGGYQVLADNLSYTIPAGTRIPGGGFMVIAASPQSMNDVYGLTNVLGPYTGSLRKAGTIRLLDEQGAVLLTAPYSNLYPWPAGADGTGHSLVLANPTYGEADPRAWDISDRAGGSPGANDSFHLDPLRDVVINELLAHPAGAGQVDFVELYNRGNTTNDLSGCILTDDAMAKRFVIPAGTFIGPGGFVEFDRTSLGFGLSAAGGAVYFLTPAGDRILDAVPFEAQGAGRSFGRWPDGANAFYPLAASTPGANNSAIWIGDIVINELMYNPISGNDDDQFIELYNQGTNAISLANWQFTAGINFTFPTNAFLAPDAYLVIARNLTNLFAKYPNLNPGNTLGNFGARLSHNGERVALARPQTLNDGSTVYVVEDEVTYGTGGRWGQWAGGGGSSLELIDPRANHRLAANWADSDETGKSSWVAITTTGLLDNGANYDATIDCVQLGLLDAGECLIDQVQVQLYGGNGSNYVKNSDFESGLSDWSMQGCLVRSSLENSGYQSGHSLRVRCTDRIWTGGNYCQGMLTANPLRAGVSATLSYRARWLRGWPEVLMRLSGNWLEATGAMPVPANLGTPGASNSRRLAHAGPAIYEVAHAPVLPGYGDSVVITARAQDPDGLQSLTLHYRADYSTQYTTVPMTDDGAGGDALAGDGLYSATFSSQEVGAKAAFYISAVDKRGAATRFPALTDDNAPVRECVVCFGDADPGGSFGVYHLWLTQTNVDRWSSLPDLSNEMMDGTFVCGNRVIYNMQARYAGSPYHQDWYSPEGLCHYKFQFPDDDKFLGATSFNKIHAPGNAAGDDGSLQREQAANTFLRALGVPWLNRRYVALYIDGNRPAQLMEDAQTPDSDMVKEFYPGDADGHLYKMQPWFEFPASHAGSYIDFNNASWCNLMPYLTTGAAKKTARYRYTFEIRRTGDSANNFTNVFSLIDAASAPSASNYVASMESLADMENWMRVFAANHAAGNWDSFGAQNAQNLYGYVGAQGVKYSLMMFDFNIVLGNSGSWGPGADLYTFNAQDPNLQNVFVNPAFRRMYVRALQELVNGPLTASNSTPLLDAKYSVFAANGLTSIEGTASIKNWLASARSSIASQISSQTGAPFTVNPPSMTGSNVAYLTGTAPVNIKTVWINGIEWPVTWLSLLSWRVAVPLNSGTNLFSVVGVDRKGQVVAGANGGASVVFDGEMASPVGRIVINEIMYRPRVPEAQYLELYNTSSNTMFDLSGWQLRGLAYAFPPGSFIAPNGFLVLAGNRGAFAAAYGARVSIFDTFSGALSSSGQTLTLVRPGMDASGDLVVSEVRYESAAPWPAGAAGLGSSLQLMDPLQDNWRVGNWTGGYPPVSFSPATANKTLSALSPFPSLWLNEIQPENLTGITNSAGQRAPWLEIYNPGASSVSLDGLYLANSYTNLGAWAFPTGMVISPGKFQVVFADSQTNLSTAGESHASFRLSPGSGALALTRWDTNGLAQVLDYINYTNVGPDHSYGSFPDGQSFARQEFLYPTPGALNDGTPPLTVAINEWMASNTRTILNPVDGKSDDWFELYNYGTNAVDLAGCYLAHSLTNPVEFKIPAGFTIAPHGFLLVWADKNATTNGAALHVNFKLSKAGASIALYATNGALVDYVSFGPQTSDVSMGRYPDGGANIMLLPTATPGASNPGPNTPPVMAPPGDRFLYLGQTLSFTLQASDSDLPAQVLTYSLDPGGPTNASVNPTNGWFAWMPLAGQAPSTNRVAARVTDNGVPPLSADQAFTIIVGLPPKLSVAVLEADQFALSWPSLPGRSYQMEYSDDLTAGPWTALGGPLLGTGAVLTATSDLAAPAQRFYRLRLLP